MKPIRPYWWIITLLLSALLLSVYVPRHVGASNPHPQQATDGHGQPSYALWPIPDAYESSQPPPSSDREFLITQGANDLFRPAATSGGLIVWYTEGDEDMDIFGLRLDDDGYTPGDPFLIAGGPGDQAIPSVAANTKDGGYLVVWHDQRNDGADIYGSYLSDDGQPLGDPFAVSAAGGDQLRPTAAYAPDTDAFLVVWQDSRLDGDPDIYARSVPSFRTSQSGDGEVPLGDEFVISAAAGGQYIPTIACETDRPYCLVAWQDNRNAEWLFTDIMGYLVRADTGSTIGEELQVAAESDFQYSPVVAFNPVSSEYLVVWDDDISCRRVSRDGQLLGRKIYVSLESPHQYKPAVAVGEDGTYLIVWEDLRNLNDRLADIFGQWLSSTGQPQGANFALSEDPNNQYSPTVVAGQGWGQESFLILWEDDRTSEGILSLYGRWLPVGAGGE